MLTQHRKWLVMGLCLAGGLFVLGPVDSPQPWEEEVPWSAFEGLAERAHPATAAEVAEWLPRVDPHGQLGALVELKDDELVFHQSEEPGGSEVVLRLSPPKRERAKDPDSGQGLQGLRVVLDPGHYGGVWAEAEQRHHEVEGKVPILEGNLTYATALNLGRLLDEEGATVWLTRGAPPREPIRYVDQRDFDLEREASLWLTHQHEGLTGMWKALYPMRAADWALRAIKTSKITRSGPHLFALSDLRRRSELSNRCRADVTISIHYNASGNPEVNHLMVFMPGNFMPGELDSEASRYYALRQLVDGALPTTVTLGARVARAMSTRMGLQVRPASKKLNRLAIAQAPGVYARNLSVLKRTRGPVLLVEGPFVTNPAEYDKLMAPLSAKEPAPRIRQLSEALLAALRASADELRALRFDDKELDTSGCAGWTPAW